MMQQSLSTRPAWIGKVRSIKFIAIKGLVLADVAPERLVPWSSMCRNENGVRDDGTPIR